MTDQPEVSFYIDENIVALRMNPLLQFFDYAHLPPHLQEISRIFHDIAWKLVQELPANQERTTALRKLLESKDCAVRARLFKT